MRRLSASGWVWFSLVFGLMTMPGAVQAETERLALVVGVREFPASEKLSPLAFTEPDADEIAATLKGSGFRVILMTQAAAKPQGQQRFNPTAAFIRRQFEGLVGTPNLDKEDCLLVTLAGHGIQLPSKTAAEKHTFYFCAADAQIDDLKFSEDVQDRHNLIPVQELYDTLKQCEAGVKLLVVDACRNDPNKVDTFRSANSLTRPPVPLPPGGIATLFSCSTNQRAAEDADLKHGVFTHFFIEALKGQGDLDGDKQIDLTELQKYVSSRTYTHVFEKYGTRQLPEFKGDIAGWAPLLTLNASRPAVPGPTPMPMPQQRLDKLVGSKEGDLWDGNSLKMKFRWCPPGKFKMGSPGGEKQREMNEDQVTVTLTKGFWMGEFEVTQAEYEAVTGRNPSYFNQGDAESGRFPVEQVSWNDAVEFCKKLTAQERKESRLPAGWEYTLPAEAQWEYACRAGTTTATAFGNSLSGTQANFNGDFPYNGGEKGPNKAQTVAVGSYQPNPWNLSDMHGNVYEWCRDGYVATLPGGTDPEVQAEGMRVSRGGSWMYYSWYSRSARRSRENAVHSSRNQGFRVALVPTGPGQPVSQAPVVSPSPVPNLDKFTGTKPGDLREDNGLKMKFCWCPPGKFRMGEEAGMVDVNLTRGFWLGQHEVLQTQWEQIMQTTPWKDQDYRKEDGNYPATNLSYAEALEFCQKLTEQERNEQRLPADWAYTLPTEAQWEYACRAGTKTAFSFGDDPALMKPYGWFSENTFDIGEQHAHEVGKKKPNAWGLHDMHGNSYEWVRDWYAERLPGGSDPEVDLEATLRLYRGGSWYDYASNCRSALRLPDSPDVRKFNLGLRLALVSTAPAQPVSLTPVVNPSPQPLPNLENPAKSKAGETWDGNGLRLAFCWCPPGKFRMGEDPGVVDVTLTKGFWLGQHEVTLAQWEQIMQTTPWKDQDYRKEDGNYPATNMNWIEAAEFCQKLTAQEREAGRLPEGWEYILPTEAQWEYACRAGTKTVFYFGDDDTQMKPYGWYSTNTWDIGKQHAHEIGQKKPNAWNLHDMHGNVQEWVRDWYAERLPGGSDPEVDLEATHRIYRGGGWYDYSVNCRSALRSLDTPEGRHFSRGFRVALVSTGEASESPKVAD